MRNNSSKYHIEGSICRGMRSRVEQVAVVAECDEYLHALDQIEMKSVE